MFHAKIMPFLAKLWLLGKNLYEIGNLKNFQLITALPVFQPSQCQAVFG